MGQCSIQAPDQTCSIHMQEQLHRLGQGLCQGWGTGTIGHPQHPWVLGPWASLPPLEPGDRGLGCSHGWDPITLARKKDGTRSMKSGQSIALDSVQGWHSLAHWKGLVSYPERAALAGRGSAELSSPQEGLTLILERLSRVGTKPHSSRDMSTRGTFLSTSRGLLRQ